MAAWAGILCGSVAGKMQFGSAWWSWIKKDGMTAQLNSLSNIRPVEQAGWILNRFA